MAVIMGWQQQQTFEHLGTQTMDHLTSHVGDAVVADKGSQAAQNENAQHRRRQKPALVVVIVLDGIHYHFEPFGRQCLARTVDGEADKTDHEYQPEWAHIDQQALVRLPGVVYFRMTFTFQGLVRLHSTPDTTARIDSPPRQRTWPACNQHSAATHCCRRRYQAHHPAEAATFP